ncbi:MAG: hypothetical protein KJ726_00555 [Verrucomicrobia bacterium]|nr:hypothetical protein [Verrucomicrobiota bacterium]MBU1908520.1 hypothetical protein [Verrucomicrobiota bacterium]
MAMSRKQRLQLFLLIGMWAVGGLIALHIFVFAPFLAKRGKSSRELDDLNENIQKAKLAAQSEAKLREDYDRAIGDIRLAMEQYIVPPESPLSWVTEKVYAAARSVNVHVGGVTPVRMPDAAWDALVKAGRFLRPYAVQITLECSYAEMAAVVTVFETSNPFLCITGINVIGQDQNVTRHQVILQVEWPMWGRPLGIPLPGEEETPVETPPAS